MLTVISLVKHLASSTWELEGNSVLVKSANTRSIKLLAAGWVFWVVGPPLLLSFEYFYLYKLAKRPGSFAAFKYGQEQPTKVWAAIVVVIGAVLLKSFK